MQHGRGGQAGQRRRVLGPAIGRVVSVAALRQTAAMQQRLEPSLNGHQQRADLVILSLMRSERHATTAI